LEKQKFFKLENMANQAKIAKKNCKKYQKKCKKLAKNIAIFDT
jgi:hypothetical protein